MDTTTNTCTPEPSPQTQNVGRGPTPGSATSNVAGNSFKPSALPSPICFRIRGIPPHWESKDVMEHLTNRIDRELDWNTARLSGPFPSPFGDRQCALLNLDYCTNYLSIILSDQNTEEYSVVEVNQKTFHMVIDRHFYDLTPLNKPSLPIVADVIAITGLGGHAFGSWRSRRRTSRPIERPMWIRDFLPERFPNTRIMTYGYNCSLVNPNETRMMDYRQNLEDALLNARRDCKDRKIIFIGHSLGALLVIQLLVQWSNNLAQNHLRDCVRGIFLFGAPHQGMDATDLYSLVEEDTDGQKCAGLLAQLKAGSEFLVNQRRSLVNVVGELKGVIYSFFETQKTEKVTPRVDPEAKEYVERVNPLSAQLFLPKERCIQVDSSHTDMVKLSSAEDPIFQTVVTGIFSCLSDNGPESILGRLSWTLARKRDWSNPVDRFRHEEQCDVEDLKWSKTYFWLFQDPVYKNWSKEDNGFKVLVVGGHKNLSPLTSYHQRVMPKIQSSCLPLCFSYSSMWTTKDAQVVWELFGQAMDACSQEHQDLIFTQFLKRLIECKTSLEQAELASISNVTPQKILDASRDSELWSALGSAIGTIARCPDKADSPTEGFKSLAIILYLGGAERTEYHRVIESIRTFGHYVEHSFDRVRVLILSGSSHLHENRYRSAAEYSVLYSIYTQEREKCLKSLAFQNIRYEKVSSHQEHTLDWLGKTEEYRSWNTLRRDHPGFLLIEGKPGSGKSTLMRYIHENINRVGEDKIIGSFFYSARDGTAESSHLNMLKTLLHSVLEADETFFLHFQKRNLKRRGSQISKDWGIEELKEIMMDVCTSHPFPSTIYWVIDALDESDNTNRIEIVQHFEKILGAVQNNKAGPLVKIVLGSRPLNELQDNLSEATVTRRISLQEKTKGDIQKYTIARLKNKVFRKCDMSLRGEFEGYIVATANGVFLWVRLVMDELEQKVRNGSSISNLLGLLKSLPKDLESFYEHIFKELRKDRDEHELVNGGRILGLCLLSHRAIELGELCDALALFDTKTRREPDPTGWEQNRSVNIRNLVTCCAGGLVDIKDRKSGFAVAQLMHETVREFLKSPSQSMIGTPFNITDYGEVSHRISLMCVQFLEIICEELKPGGKGDPISTEYLNNRPLLKYSVEYLLETYGSVDAKVEARLKRLIEGLRDSLGSNAHTLLWKLAGPTVSDDIRNKLGILLLNAARKGHAMAISNLLAVGVDIEFGGPVNHNRALHFAASGGHESAAIVLLEGDANVNGRNVLHVTPLYSAAAAGQIALFELLLSHGVDISDDDFWWTLIEFAAANGQTNFVRRILRADLGNQVGEPSNRDIWRALRLALMGGYNDIAMELLQTNLTFYGDDSDGFGILSSAAIGGNETTIKKVLDLAGPPKGNNQNYDEYINLGGLYGNISGVELFKKLGGAAKSPNKSDIGGETLYTGGIEKADIAKFNTAVVHDHCDIMDLLIARGLDITTCSYDDNRYTALHLAVRNGAGRSCEYLLFYGANPDARDWSGSTPLHLVFGKNNEQNLIEKLVVNYGADVDAVNKNGETPLHHAVRGGSVDACRVLLDHDASLEAPDNNGETLLHHAVRGGSEEACLLLLEHGASLEAANNNGETPLHHAARGGSVGVCRLLLECDADPEASAKNGETPLHYAVKGRLAEVCRVLLERGASPEAADNNGETPLHYAVRGGPEDVCRLLLGYDASLEAADNNGETLLHHAARGGEGSMCLLLLEHGASIKAADKNGSTPLHMAAMSGHIDVCKILVGNRADRSVIDLNGLTPSRVALQAGFASLSRFLSSPDEDSRSKITDSNGLDPPSPGPATRPEEHPVPASSISENGTPGLVHLAGAGSSLETNSAPLEMVRQNSSFNEPRRSARLRGTVTSLMELDDVRENKVSLVPRRRSRSSSDIVRDSTERVKPKRRRNTNKEI